MYINQKKLTMDTYKPLDTAYRTQIEAFVSARKSVRIQYFSDIQEFITRVAIIKKVYEKEGAAYMELSSGDEIRLDKIVRIEDKPAPGYDTNYFACDI
jgi:Rho-binding antiterminator